MNFVRPNISNHSLPEAQACGNILIYPIPFIFLILAYFIFFMMSIIGNTIVISTVIKNNRNKFRTPVHFMIFNLAVIHLLITCFSSPIALARDILGYWFSDMALCTIYGSFTNAFAIIEMLTMGLMAVERYRAVSNLGKNALTVPQVLITIGIIWLLGVLVIIPSIVSASVRETQIIVYCTYHFQPRYNINDLVYTAALVILLCMIPFIIILLLHISLVYKLKRYSAEARQRLGEAAIRNNSKVTEILWILTVSFFLCWLPIFICAILIAFSVRGVIDQFCGFRIFFIIAHVLGFSYAGINPVVLITLSDIYNSAVWQCCNHKILPAVLKRDTTRQSLHHSGGRTDEIQSNVSEM